MTDGSTSTSKGIVRTAVKLKDIEVKTSSEHTEEMPQSRSTDFPGHQTKEKWGTHNDETNAQYATTDVLSA